MIDLSLRIGSPGKQAAKAGTRLTPHTAEAFAAALARNPDPSAAQAADTDASLAPVTHHRGTGVDIRLQELNREAEVRQGEGDGAHADWPVPTATPEQSAAPAMRLPDTLPGTLPGTLADTIANNLAGNLADGSAAHPDVGELATGRRVFASSQPESAYDGAVAVASSSAAEARGNDTPARVAWQPGGTDAPDIAEAAFSAKPDGSARPLDAAVSGHVPSPMRRDDGPAQRGSQPPAGPQLTASVSAQPPLAGVSGAVAESQNSGGAGADVQAVGGGPSLQFLPVAVVSAGSPQAMRITMAVRPEGLGSITVTISREQDRVALDITAEQAGVAEALIQDPSMVLAALADLVPIPADTQPRINTQPQSGWATMADGAGQGEAARHDPDRGEPGRHNGPSVPRADPAQGMGVSGDATFARITI